MTAVVTTAALQFRTEQTRLHQSFFHSNVHQSSDRKSFVGETRLLLYVSTQQEAFNVQKLEDLSLDVKRTERATSENGCAFIHTPFRLSSPPPWPDRQKGGVQTGQGFFNRTASNIYRRSLNVNDSWCNGNDRGQRSALSLYLFFFHLLLKTTSKSQPLQEHTISVKRL